MAWSTPYTSWVAGDQNTATAMNRIEANVVYLNIRPSSQYVLNQGSDYTTTSTSFTDTDTTNLALTITTNGGDVMVHFHGISTNSAAVNTLYDVTVDGTRTAGDDGITGAAGTTRTTVSFTRLITGLSAGSHTFKLQWKVASASTGTLYAGAGTSGSDVHPQFWVKEV